MADEEIRILQLADLFIGSGPKQLQTARRDYKRLVNRLAAAREMGERAKIDYLVISGNLTRNGAPEEFENAREVIRELAGNVLRDDARDQWRARTIVVPGPHDHNLDTPNYMPFDAFYNDKDHGFAEFDYELTNGQWHDLNQDQVRLTVRMDSNLTTVGFFWDDKARKGAEKAVWEVIRRNLRTWSAGGPLVLVSASVPVPMADQSFSPEPGRVFHLIGHTPYPMMDRLRYHALNCELRTDRNRARLCRAHVITTFPTAKPRIWPRVQTCEFKSVAGDPDPYTPSNPPQRPQDDRTETVPFPFESTCRKLWDLIRPPDRAQPDPPGLILVRGFPGAGKFSFYKTFNRATQKHFRSSPDRSSFTYLVQSVKLWQDDSLEVCKTEIAAARQKLRARMLEPNRTPGILMVYDQGPLYKQRDSEGMPPGPPETPPRKKEPLLDVLRQTHDSSITTVFLTDDEMGLSTYIVKLKSIEDKALDDQGIGWLPIKATVWLPPLEGEEWHTFRGEFDRVPVDECDLQFLTGRLHGVSTRALEALSSDTEPGSKKSPLPITRQQRWEELLALSEKYEEVQHIEQRLKLYVEKVLPKPALAHIKTMANQLARPPRRPNGTINGATQFTTTEERFQKDPAVQSRYDEVTIQMAWKDWLTLLREWGFVPSHDADRSHTPNAPSPAPAENDVAVGPLLPFLSTIRSGERSET